MTSKLRPNHPSRGILAHQSIKGLEIAVEVKVTVTVLFNFNGIVQNKFLTEGQKVNKEPCCLHEAGFVEKLFMAFAL